MKLILQKGIDPATNESVWLMLDGETYQVVEPIQRYLTSLSTSRSPNTVESYGYDLKLWWTFLELKHLDWRNINVSDLEDFAYWLRTGNTSVVSIQPVEAKRTEKSINRAITAVTGFYDYHIANKTVDFKQFDRFHLAYGMTKGGLLTGIAKSKPVRQKLVKLKESKKPGVVNTMFYRLSQKTGIKVYPHLFRHSYATRLLKAQYPPERVKYLLGHTSIQTTLDIYSHVIEEIDLRRVIKEEEE